MKKIFVTLLIFISSLSYSYSQCNVDIRVDTTSVDTLRICLGDSIDLNAIGNCNYFMFNDFNNGTVGTGWYSNASPMFNNPCPPLGPPASGIVCWIGSATNFPRELTTVAYDLSGVGCSIEFDMKYGDIQTSVNCEDPDEADEGVYLQYSIDGAVTWVTINYWTPNSTISGPLYTWTHYFEPIPPAAFTTATQFRWWQDATSGFEWDHWGIDNVEIKCASNQIINWSTGYSVFDPPPVYPTQTVDITCYIMNIINGDFAIDSLHVIVGDPEPDLGLDTIVCYGDSVNLSVDTPNITSYIWNIGDTTSSIIVYPVDTFNYIVTVTDVIGCVGVDTVEVITLPLISAPNLRCVDVLPSGDITLSWISTIDNVQCFNGYLINHSYNISGPYNILDTIFDVNTLDYTHVGVNGQSQISYYFIEILTGSNNTHTLPSNTVNSILTNVVNNGTADITWNSINTNTNLGIYYIFRKYSFGMPILVDSTNLLNYSDTISVCSDSVFYYVQIYDSSGCVSTSSIGGNYFWTNPPTVPILDSVSVDNLGNIILGWQSSVNVIGYLIYHFESGIWTKIDTVWGNNTTVYTDTSSDPCSQSEAYCIASFDYCGSSSTIGFNNIHHSIYLDIKDINPCADFITLRWNKYINFDSKVAGYNIFISENDDPFILYDNSVDTSFIHEGLNKGSIYCYFIQAFDYSGEKTSSSCIRCFAVNKPPRPEFIYLRYATIVNNDHVSLMWYNDTSEFAHGYRILRSETTSGPFEEIKNITLLTPLVNPNISFTDNNARFDKRSYYYKIVVVDSCGLDVLISNIAKTIYLTVNSEVNMTNTLNWSAYKEWPWSFVRSYGVYREIDGSYGMPVFIASTPNNTTNFIDDVSNYFETTGEFSYYVEAVQEHGIPEFENDISVSNEVTVLQEPMVYVSNAFAPTGYNNIFLPVSAFTDKSNYNFYIYNRWGELLFETSNTDIGWDGTYKGDYVPLGVYIYLIKIHTSLGVYFEKRGSVTVIK